MFECENQFTYISILGIVTWLLLIYYTTNLIY